MCVQAKLEKFISRLYIHSVSAGLLESRQRQVPRTFPQRRNLPLFYCHLEHTAALRSTDMFSFSFIHVEYPDYLVGGAFTVQGLIDCRGLRVRDVSSAASETGSSPPVPARYEIRLCLNMNGHFQLSCLIVCVVSVCLQMMKL